MSPKQVTKRCHWVPQVYLRNFASDPDRLKIWRYSKELGEPERKPIEKVAVKFYLYVPFGDSGSRDDSFERRLSDLEKWLDSPIWKALCEDMLDLGWEPLRKMVSLLVSTMYLRNPNQFTLTKHIHSQLLEFCSGAEGLPSSLTIAGRPCHPSLEEWHHFKNLSENELRRMWISEISNAAEFAKLLMKMRWTVLFSDKPVFVTTDNPVVFLHPSLKFKGISDPETTLLFPISPTRVLTIDNRHEEPANCYYPLKASPGIQNLLMWRNSIEYMFSHRHPDIVCRELADAADGMGIS